MTSQADINPDSSTAKASLHDKLIYQALLLGGTCFLVSLLLLGGNALTTASIEHHITNDKMMMLKQVLPAALYDNDPRGDSVALSDTGYFSQPVNIYIARKNGIINGAGVQAAVQGWGGQIDFILGVNNDMEITGVRIISHKDTPGLADKIEIEKDPWITSFDGKSLINTSETEWAVKKDGGIFDQFTGATITPRAVVNGVHEALKEYRSWRDSQLVKSPPQETAP
jgi:electron transport complex protein RnfG